MKKASFIVLAALALFSCETNTPAPTCNSTTGTELCFKGKTYHFDTVFWEKVGDHIEIQLEPNVTGPGDYAGIYAFLYGSTIQTDTLPHIGTYTSIPYGSTPTGSLDCSGFLMTISGSTTDTYTYEQDASNTLSITGFTSNQVAGNGSFKFRNSATNEVNTAIFSFENIPFQ